MKMDDLLQMGAKIFSESNLSGDAGSNLDLGSIVSALSGVTGGHYLLRLSNEEAAGGLSEALPKIMDQGSSGGSLLDSIDGIEGALGLAGKIFGK